jgi:hypothetical protein
MADEINNPGEITGPVVITDLDIVEFSRNFARVALVQWLQSGATAAQLLAVAQTPIPGGSDSVIGKINAAIEENGDSAIVLDGGRLMSLKVLRSSILVAGVVDAFLNNDNHPIFHGEKPSDIIRLTASASGDTRSRI